ncbi:anthranilate synthase component 2 [Nocardioides terrae]|uniref:Anthranilate synthase component 2 n=1 Tax=Nocardioides terrae TaxID=574651 RepID=A0A1I1GZC1_9ACTN|nr:aminodeoxychorismate/anthranilate synthase component II [Nocardioides terrae]SFC14290.1 anthranilate synthase component 2 [Nocardioides terrae]
MRRVVVVDHHDSYTWNLVHLIASVIGESPQVVEHDETSLDEIAGFTHVVLSPGPGHPDEYDWSVLELGLPVLGVCLGMQGLVTTYGGVVDRVEPAHGDVATVRHDGRGVFRGVPDPFEAVRYHSLAALVLPECLEPTAWAGDDTVMGVRHRTLPLEGVQFHPESILSTHGADLVRNFLGPA